MQRQASNVLTLQPFLLALRAQAIPASLIPTLYDLQPPVSFIDGCLVVEIQDFRPTTSHTNPYQQIFTSTSQVSPTKPGPPVTEPVKTRVVMRPTSETLAETIELMIERKGDHWGDGAALDLEARILVSFNSVQLLIAVCYIPSTISWNFTHRCQSRCSVACADSSGEAQPWGRWHISPWRA